MITDELEKEMTKLEKYLKKQGRNELVQELHGLKSDQLKSRLLGQAMHYQEIMDTKAIDEKLTDALELVKSLRASYNEQLRMNKKISRFISLLLKDKV